MDENVLRKIIREEMQTAAAGLREEFRDSIAEFRAAARPGYDPLIADARTRIGVLREIQSTIADLAVRMRRLEEWRSAE